MGKEIAFENGRISEFEGLLTLTWTLDRVILYTVMYHSTTSTYIQNFIEIEETFSGRTDGRTFETRFIRSTRTSRPKMCHMILTTPILGWFVIRKARTWYGLPVCKL